MSAATSASHRGPTRARAHLGRCQAAYSARPLLVAAILFSVLAVLRIGGAYLDALLVVSLVITPAVLLFASAPVRRDLGLVPIASRSRLAIGTAVVVASYAVSVGACVLVFGTGPDNWAAGLLTVFDESVPGALPGRPAVVVFLAVLCLGLLVPLAEEVCYRGLLLHAVASRWGAGVGVVVTSAAWTLVHLGDYGLAPLDARVLVGMLPSVFLMGLALGWCRLVTGSVFGSTFAQGFANLLLAGWVVLW